MSRYKEQVWEYLYEKANPQPWGGCCFYLYYMHPISRVRVCKRMARYGDSMREITHTWECASRHNKKKAKRKKG